MTPSHEEFRVVYYEPVKPSAWRAMYEWQSTLEDAMAVAASINNGGRENASHAYVESRVATEWKTVDGGQE